MWTKAFWIDLTERSVKSAAQSVILGLGLGEGFNLFGVDWKLAIGFAGGGALLSALTSLASIATRNGTAQLGPGRTPTRTHKASESTVLGLS
ncbi:MAG: hypothetical protein GY906_10375 [bacterium]|nr:hypothetical protein [bacterium]